MSMSVVAVVMCMLVKTLAHMYGVVAVAASNVSYISVEIVYLYLYFNT